MYRQYVIVRNDIPKYTHGMILAQGIHASIAALEVFRNNKETKMYLNDLKNMTTIVLSVSVFFNWANIENFLRLKQDLLAENIDHYVWIEKPEMIETAIATRPLEIENNPTLKNILLPLKLYK